MSIQGAVLGVVLVWLILWVCQVGQVVRRRRAARRVVREAEQIVREEARR